MAKKTDVFYSLLNLVNGQILSAPLNGFNSWNLKSGETFSRRRNWKTSQFSLGGSNILECFINSVPLDASYSLGISEIWVKEKDIDDLYTSLAFSVMSSLCHWEKQPALVGAFLFQKNPQLFLDTDFTSRYNSLYPTIVRLKLGMEFIEFLETFGVLKFTESRYKRLSSGQLTTKEDIKTYTFSTAEFELIKRERKDIQTIFSYTKE